MIKLNGAAHKPRQILQNGAKVMTVKNIIGAYDFGRPFYVNVDDYKTWKTEHKLYYACDGTFRDEYDEIVFNNVDALDKYFVYNIGADDKGLHVCIALDFLYRK